MDLTFRFPRSVDVSLCFTCHSLHSYKVVRQEVKMYSFLFFFICLNVAAFIINEAAFLPESEELAVTPTDVMATFTWENLLLSLGVGGAIAGIVALLTRQYVYAVGALIIWAIGSLTPVIQWFFIGVPLLLNSVLPSEISFIGSVVQGLFAVVFFMFIIELTAQRQIT